MKFAYRNKLASKKRAAKTWSKEPYVERHFTQRQGDETACTCGKRWPAGEEHP
jgi:hypothetical protein